MKGGRRCFDSSWERSPERGQHDPHGRQESRGRAGPDQGTGQRRVPDRAGRHPSAPASLTEKLGHPGGGVMPRGRRLRGVGAKERRQYEHIKESAQKSGRYGQRAKEVAARTVVKPSQKETTQKSQITKKLE